MLALETTGPPTHVRLHRLPLAANALADPVPAELREERRARLMAVQEKISSKRLKRKQGETITVLVDSIEDGQAVARSSADAPEIDGVVHITAEGKHAAKLAVGEFARVRVTRSDRHDLYAVPVPD